MRAIHNIERAALADCRSYCTIDLTLQRQSLIIYLTQHATEVVQSIYAVLRTRLLGKNNAVLPFLPTDGSNPPGTIEIRPDGSSDVVVSDRIVFLI